MPAVIPLIIAGVGAASSAYAAHSANKGAELGAAQNQEALDMQRRSTEQSGERSAWKDLLHASGAINSKPYAPSVAGIGRFGTDLQPESADPTIMAAAQKFRSDAKSRIDDPSKNAGGTPTDVPSYFPGTGQTIAGSVMGAIPLLLQAYPKSKGGGTPFVGSTPGQVPFSFGGDPHGFEGWAQDNSWMDEGIG